MRLTERMEDGSYDVKQCRDCITFNCVYCKHLTKAIQKLGKLEDIHNGLLQKRRHNDGVKNYNGR